MKNNKFALKIIALIVITMGSLTIARVAAQEEGADEVARGRHSLQNQDLRFIFEWERDRKVRDLAEQLTLSVGQVATLREVKAEVEEIRAEIEQRKAALNERLATTAAQIRARIESDGVLSEEDKGTLRGFRVEMGDLKQEERLRLSLATMVLKNLLTEDQKEIMEQVLGPDQETDRGSGLFDKGRRARGRHKARVGIRVLLSDGFLGYYD